EEGARAVVARLPGTLRFGHRKLHTLGLPLVEHGPLIALAARFGDRIAGPLVPRLDDPSPDMRFHAALIFAEVRSELAVAPLGERLFDADVAVRRAAAVALGRYAPSLALAALLEHLRE